MGTGAGFLKQYIPSLITSDLFRVEGVDVLLDGRNLPFRKASLQGIVMINVPHHIPDTRAFFKDVARCVPPRGIVAMIEPWVTPWSRLVFTMFHDEPFQPESMNWDITDAGLLSSANGALPWIIFHLDTGQFEHEFPEWSIIDILPITPFLYMVSGGVSIRNLMPGWTFELLHMIENSFTPWMTGIAMFARIVLMRNASTTNNSNPINGTAI